MGVGGFEFRISNFEFRISTFDSESEKNEQNRDSILLHFWSQNQESSKKLTNVDFEGRNRKLKLDIYRLSTFKVNTRIWAKKIKNRYSTFILWSSIENRLKSIFDSQEESIIEQDYWKSMKSTKSIIFDLGSCNMQHISHRQTVITLCCLKSSNSHIKTLYQLQHHQKWTAFIVVFL